MNQSLQKAGNFDQRKRIIVGILYLGAVILFILGVTNPIMGSEVLLGLKTSKVYLTDSITYFYKREEWFLGTILLIFTIVLPILKLIYLGLQILGVHFGKSKTTAHILNIINKWAMLDVFIVALLIMTFKFDTTIVDQYILIGTTYFAAAILLIMLISYLLRYGYNQKDPNHVTSIE